VGGFILGAWCPSILRRLDFARTFPDPCAARSRAFGPGTPVCNVAIGKARLRTRSAGLLLLFFLTTVILRIGSNLTSTADLRTCTTAYRASGPIGPGVPSARTACWHQARVCLDPIVASRTTICHLLLHWAYTTRFGVTTRGAAGSPISPVTKDAVYRALILSTSTRLFTTTIER